MPDWSIFHTVLSLSHTLSWDLSYFRKTQSSFFKAKPLPASPPSNRHKHNTYLFCFKTAPTSRHFHPCCLKWSQNQCNTGPSCSKPIWYSRFPCCSGRDQQVTLLSEQGAQWRSQTELDALLCGVGEFEETRKMVLWLLLLKKIEKSHRGLKLSLGGTYSPFTQSFVFLLR